MALYKIEIDDEETVFIVSDNPRDAVVSHWAATKKQGGKAGDEFTGFKVTHVCSDEFLIIDGQFRS